MELKTRYQYTYFIYPYLVKEKKYSKYLLKLLKSKEFELKIFQKEKDFDVYTYFLPKIRDYMFNSFSFNKDRIRALEEMSLDTKAAVLAKQPCTIFEYNANSDIQGKTGTSDGIFFKIQKVQLICFNTGICFLCIKTNVEDTEDFANILNFNYKFRDIAYDNNSLNNYDNIRVQTDTFKDIKQLTDFIKDITGTNSDAGQLDLGIERFLTYSYACVDQGAWNNETDFENIKSIFTKYVNILPNDNSVNYTDENTKIISEWKYTKLGITKWGITLFSSTADMNNFTELPQAYETKYLYTYIFALYKKLYLKKISEEFKNIKNVNEARKELADFTKKLWEQEITADSIGTLFYSQIKEVLEIDELYNKVKNKYDILYKRLNIEKDKKANIFIAVILLVSLAFNIFNFIALAIK